MDELSLTADQKKHMEPDLKRFVQYAATEAYSHDQTERVRRVRYFQEELPNSLESLSEIDVTELISMLWATQNWGNKQWLAQKVIDGTGLDSLREELTRLFDSRVSVGARYERALQRIHRLGPASITEMLCYIDPQRSGIWNDRSRLAIRKLGLDSMVPAEKYKISGVEYERFNALLAALGVQLRNSGISDVDLLSVDFFLYEVATSDEPAPPKVGAGAFDHDEIRDLIQSVGTLLGFDAETEKRIAHGAIVDVVWRARIGNLGMVKYVFEVHKSGSIDSLLLNLQKAKSDGSVQKVIAVSDDAQLERIAKETEGLQEEFRRSLNFWSVSDVQAVAGHLQMASESINRLGLVPVL